MIKYIDNGHKYLGIEDNQPWKGVTSTISLFHEKFSTTPETCALRKPTKTKPNKWYGIDPKEIKKAWEDENNRSTFLGHWYHKKQEDNPLLCNSLEVKYCNLVGEEKLAGSQKLIDGIYIEYLFYLESIRLCGQADKVIVKDKTFSVYDYKTCKEIKKESYVGYEEIGRAHV